MRDAMATLESGALFARLASAYTRVRAAARPDDVLDAAAEEARAVVGARHAWAARAEGGIVVSLRSASDGVAPSDPADDALTALLVAARPIARQDGFVAAGLFGSNGTSEGVLILDQGSDGADDPARDIALAQLATVTGLALEAARLRARVEAVTRARETLLASVAHDLRNPLNTFAMSAGLLRDDAERNDVDATRALGLITRMERATARMQGLIDDLVEASRIDARKIDLTVKSELASQLVKDAVSAASSSPDKSAVVACDTVDDDARVMADRARTLQLLAKLIAFGSKCTGDSGTIRLGVMKSGDEVVFTARALGPGGLPVPAPKEGRGGLGLLIARGLVEAQRGTFRLESGDALAVAFTLPAARP
jgi:K+-sensing histidine kinase KdpD